MIGTLPAPQPRRRPSPLALLGIAALCLLAALAIVAAPALAARPRIVKPRFDALVVLPHGKLRIDVRSPGKGKGSRPHAEVDGRKVAAHLSRSGKAWTGALSVAGLSTGVHNLSLTSAGGTDTRRFLVARRAPGAVEFTWHTGWRKRAAKLLDAKARKPIWRVAGYPKVFLNAKRVHQRLQFGELGNGFIGGFGPDAGLRYGRNHVRVEVLLQSGAFATSHRSFVVGRNRPLAGAGPDRRTSVGEPVVLNGGPTRLSSQLLALTPAPPATASSANPVVTASATGSGSTFDSAEPAEYEWKVISAPPGPDPKIEEGETEEPIFIPEVPGTYVIEELVKPEGGGPTGVDTVTVSSPQSNSPMGMPIQTITSAGAVHIAEESFPRKQAGVKMLVLGATNLTPVSWKGRWNGAEQTFAPKGNGEWESSEGKLLEELGKVTNQQTVILTGQGAPMSGAPLSKAQVSNLQKAIDKIGGTVSSSGQTPLGAANLENGQWSVIGYVELTEGHASQDFGLAQQPVPGVDRKQFPEFPSGAGSPGSLNGFMQKIGAKAYDFVSPEFLSLDTKWTKSPSERPSSTQNTIAIGQNHYPSATIPAGAIAMQVLVLDGSEPTTVLENSTYTILNSGCGTVGGPGGIESLDQALHGWATEGGAEGAPGGSNVVIAQDFGHQEGRCWPGGNDRDWLQDALPKISGSGVGWNGSEFPTKRPELISIWNSANVHGFGSVAGNFGVFAGTAAHDAVANYRRPFWDSELEATVNRDYGGLTLVSSTNLYQRSAAYFQGQGEDVQASNPSNPEFNDGVVTGVLRRNEQSQWELQSSATAAGAPNGSTIQPFEQASLLELMFSAPSKWPCSVEEPAPCKGTTKEIEAAQRYFVTQVATNASARSLRELYAPEYQDDDFSVTAAQRPYPSQREQVLKGDGEFSESLYKTMQNGPPESQWHGIVGELEDLGSVAKGIRAWRQLFESGNAAVPISAAGEAVINEVNNVYDKLKKENKEEEMNGAIAGSFLDLVSYLVDIGVAASGNPEAIPVVAPSIGALGAMIDVGDDAADIYSIYGPSGEGGEVPNNTEAIRGKVNELSTEIAVRYLAISEAMGHFGSIFVDDPEKLRIAGGRFAPGGQWSMAGETLSTLKQSMINSVQRAAFETTLPMAFVQWVTSPRHTKLNGLGSLELPAALSYKCLDTHPWQPSSETSNPWPKPSKKHGNPIWAMEQIGWSGGGPTAGTNMTPQNSQNYTVRGLKSALDDMHPDRANIEGFHTGETGLEGVGTMASPTLFKNVFAAPNPHGYSLKPDGLGVSKEEIFGLEDWTTRKFGCSDPIG